MDNNYSLLRLTTAFGVLISHSYGILDKGLQQPHVIVNGLFIALSDVGLYIFFTISGYLVTQSFFTSASYGHYLWKRFVRIVPGLVVVNIHYSIACDAVVAIYREAAAEKKNKFACPSNMTT